MRFIDRIVIHCSAARPWQAARQTAADVDRMHRAERGWRKIGYHYFLRFDGTREQGRGEGEVGAGVFGFNAKSLHICYAGGLDANGRPADTRSGAQIAELTVLVRELKGRYPHAAVIGHRDLSPDRDGDGQVEPHEWLKECPCFDVAEWWAEAGRGSVS